MAINMNQYESSMALLDAAMALGVNAIDIAHVYGGGSTERAVGRWMAERGNRDQVFIITKGAHHNADRQRVTPHDITADLMDSLARLKVDYIDGYLLHRDDPSVPVGVIIDTLDGHKKAGRIGSYGGSNWTHGRIAEANAYAAANGKAPMTLSSPYYGLCDQVDNPWGGECVGISGDAHADARAYYRSHNIPVLAYSSLGRGMLSGRVTRDNHKELLDGASLKAYAHEINFKRLDRVRELASAKGVQVPQVALAYILAQPLNLYPIVGAVTPDELREIVAAADIKLTDSECRWLENGI